MSKQKEYYARRSGGDESLYEQFNSAEEAWFWFIAAQKARAEGARFTAGQALISRPCEPLDILKVVDQLRRNRMILMDHIMVLRHYGRRMSSPDRRRPKEVRAAHLWNEAMDKIEAVLIRKEIVAERPERHSNWFHDVKIYERA